MKITTVQYIKNCFNHTDQEGRILSFLFKEYSMSYQAIIFVVCSCASHEKEYFYYVAVFFE